MQEFGADTTTPSETESPESDETAQKKLNIIRTSDRATFKQCRQKWDFGSKIRQNWEPDVEGKALKFGTAIHAALETWYKPETWPVHKQDNFRNIAFAEFLGHYIESTPAHSINEWQEDVELGRAMLEGYFDYSLEADDFTPVYVEIEFEVPIPAPDVQVYLKDNFSVDSFTYEGEKYLHYKGEPVVYQGRIDLIVQDKYGLYWIWDHKTAKTFDATEHLEMDAQCGSYMWAIQQQLGIKIEGVVYNELKKDVPHPPKTLKNGKLSVAKDQNTTYELYVEELRKLGLNTLEYQEILLHLKSQGNKFFRRTQVHRSQDELEILGESIALEAIDMLNNPSIYPNPSKFNCNYCAFRTPCLNVMDGSGPEYALSEMFHIR